LRELLAHKHIAGCAERHQIARSETRISPAAGALGMWLKGFPRGMGRVESRYFGFPCFPFLVISNARLPPRGWPKACIDVENARL
jgi:hypothetical protein